MLDEHFPRMHLICGQLFKHKLYLHTCTYILADGKRKKFRKITTTRTEKNNKTKMLCMLVMYGNK